MKKQLKNIYWRYNIFFSRKLWTYKVAKHFFATYKRNNMSFNLEEKIVFVVSDAVILHHYFPITKFLEKDKYFFLVVSNNIDQVNRIVFELNKYNLNYTFPYNYLVRGIFCKVVVSISSPMGVSPLPPFDEASNKFLITLGKTQVRIMYAGGKLKWNLSDWNSIYDHIFVYGPYYAKLFKKRFKAEIHQVGYPRFDKFFSVNKSKHDLISRLSKFNQSKKTIVYLPTHGKLSAFDRFKGMLGQLTQDYNVIVKPHPWLEIKNKELNEKGILTLDKDLDNIDYFKIADFVFADYGGSVLGAIYANRNLVLLDVTNPLQDSDNMIGESPDYMMRKHILHLENPDQLDYIKGFLSDDNYWKKQEKVRLSLREKYFEFNMESGKTAALKLLGILEGS